MISALSLLKQYSWSNKNDNNLTRKNDRRGKILSMEALWQDLCQHSLVESPDWHELVLSSRQAKKEAGEQKPMGWSDAKQQILSQLK